MTNNNYAHIELNIISKNKNTIENSANYKNLARWNDSEQGNVTSVGSNGNSSFYGLFDTSGQVYEWTDDSDIDRTEFKICRGGCYADTRPFNISKEHRQKYHFNSMLSDGFFGFRVATINNPNSFNNFVNITNTGNPPDKCDENLFGIVNYNYQINKYLVTNDEYCEFLNSADPEGSNLHYLYDVRMGTSPVGGIVLVDCEESGSKYIVKLNMHNKPVTFIKWIMAAKYINWLHANKSSSPINHLYSGAYNLTNVVENFSIRTENDNIILSENSNELITEQLFSILSENNLKSNISREINAQYFIPNEDEWYKAAYYDPTIASYWKYGTKSNTDPAAVISNITGSGQYVEKYHYSVKKFPILINKAINTANILSTTINNSNNCPSISLSTNNIGDNGLYLINIIVSGLVYGSTYSYDFSKSTSNWPCSINPISGKFVANNNIEEINGILKFCPKNYDDISICESNINYGLLNNNKINNYFVELVLDTESSVCTDRLSVETIISTTGLPSIIKSQYLNIKFLSSHENSIILTDNLCCNPVPIIVVVSGHDPAKYYSYNIASSSDKILLAPNSGIVSFGADVGKITAYALGLNSRIDSSTSILSVNLQEVDDPSINTSDQILLQCLGDCEKTCDNHANFKNRAIWGICSDNTCPDITYKLRTTGAVTTVGTNGGPGPYGTYDMDGNAWELTHVGDVQQSSSYILRGGSFNSNTIGKTAVNTPFAPSIRSQDTSFRIGSYKNPYNYLNMVNVKNDTGFENIADSGNLGSVNYDFMIGKYLVTNCDYVEFLNSVASTGLGAFYSNLVYFSGMSGCYGGIDRIVSSGNSSNYIYKVQESMDHKPVVNLSSAAPALRYINWLENNKSNSWLSTTSGTYSLSSTTNSIINGNRSVCSKYFLPSENEWYKAAYYKESNTNDARYWNYSTKTFLEPDPVSATPQGNGYAGDDCPEPPMSDLIDCDYNTQILNYLTNTIP